ncbi:unnamed protein product [Dicrocoelium dendriticum]|nr:unnamed protein product [Dicrocoelium dendriticum]
MFHCNATNEELLSRPCDSAELCQSRAHRVTLKIDVPHTDHSHVIGRGGRNIKGVMLDTQCHIHFPDSNRMSQVEKSNQVTITGHVSRVDLARMRIRSMLPVIFSFTLPTFTASSPTAFRTSPFVKQLQDVYGVEICCRAPCPHDANLMDVSVKGLAGNAKNTKAAAQLLVHKYYRRDAFVPIYTVIELDTTGQTNFVGQTDPEALAQSVMRATGATVRLTKSRLVNRGCLVQSPESLGTLSSFVTPNSERTHTTSVEITGPSVDSTLLARQYITSLLPVALVFDLPRDDCELLRSFDFKRLEQLHNVSVDIRPKATHSVKSVYVRTVEGNVRSVYSTWQLINEFLAQASQISNLIIGESQQTSEPDLETMKNTDDVCQANDLLRLCTTPYITAESTIEPWWLTDREDFCTRDGKDYTKQGYYNPPPRVLRAAARWTKAQMDTDDPERAQ